MKFKIIETQIDNFNDTYNTLTTFKEGLNVICGVNEAGKSTIMEFIKNILTGKSDTKGYIKCEYEGQEFNLDAEKKSRTLNSEYLEKINPLTYKTGFIINLDDIMLADKSDEEKLINVIKDSSGNAVNSKQEEYYNYIYKKSDYKLTIERNEASRTFKDNFKKLKELDSSIEIIQKKENDYNHLCERLEALNSEFAELQKMSACTDIINKKETLEEEIKSVEVNKKLLENKSEFDKLREEFGALNSSQEKLPVLDKNISENTDKFSEIFEKLNSLEPFKEDDIDKFILDNEKFKKSKNLIEKEAELYQKKESILEKIEDINKEIEGLKLYLNQTIENNKIIEKIEDIKKYKDNRILVESLRSEYGNLNEEARLNERKKSDNQYNQILFLIFCGLFFAGLGSVFVFNDTKHLFILAVFILASLSGMLTLFIMKKGDETKLKEGYTEKLNHTASSIIRMGNTYGFTFNKEDSFTAQISALLQTMNENITQYEIAQKDILNERIRIQNEEKNLEKEEKSLEELEKNITEYNKEKEEFLSETNVRDLKNYPEIYEYIKELKTLSEKISTDTKEKENIEKLSEKFVSNLNTFIENSGLKNMPKYNKYDCADFENILNNLREILNKNIENNRIIEEKTEVISELKNSLNEFSKEIIDKVDGLSKEERETFGENKDKKYEEKIRLEKEKEGLEEVKDLINLKNAKTNELNSIKQSLSKLIQKEVIYNIILSAKEKFNETQPNLVCAKEYLNKITCGKYSEIDFDNKTISGAGIGAKGWSELSRGTKEQLYLALRLGFADNYAKDIEGNPNGLPELPLMIDDAFVNFDLKRTGAILRCLSDFSEKNQVLYFTCHTESIKKILKKEGLKYNLIEVDD